MELEFDRLGGVIPVVVQEETTREILMLGFMNREALHRTLRDGELVFYSRSRKKFWKKGEVSGHRLYLRDLHVDCDGDALVARVLAPGPGVCHEGYRSCFFRRLNGDCSTTFIAERSFDPSEVYGEGGAQ